MLQIILCICAVPLLYVPLKLKAEIDNFFD